jgi:predicted transcriptional regulator
MSSHQLAEDARTIRGILDLLQEDPKAVITVQLTAMTQNVSTRTAKRLLQNMADAGLIEHFTREAEVLGVRQRVPCVGSWVLTEKGKRSEIQSAEDLAGGIT